MFFNPHVLQEGRALFKIFKSHIYKLGIEFARVRRLKRKTTQSSIKRFTNYKKQVILITKDS